MNLTNYVVGAEIAALSDMNISNISMFLSQDNTQEGIDFLKFGSLTLINKKSEFLPKNLLRAAYNKKATNLQGLLPQFYVEEHLTEELDSDEITLDSNGIEDVQKIKKKTYIRKLQGAIDFLEISGKKFVKINNNEIYDCFYGNYVKTIINSNEYDEYSDMLKGKFNLTNEKILVWY